jgi:hypothetical protein
MSISYVIKNPQHTPVCTSDAIARMSRLFRLSIQASETYRRHRNRLPKDNCDAQCHFVSDILADY